MTDEVDTAYSMVKVLYYLIIVVIYWILQAQYNGLNESQIDLYGRLNHCFVVRAVQFNIYKFCLK